MVKNKNKLHSSDVIYLIYSEVGTIFSFNDIKHIVTNSQLRGIYGKGYIFKTGATVTSNSNTRPTKDISQWQISNRGIAVMNQFSMKDKMEEYKKELLKKSSEMIIVNST